MASQLINQRLIKYLTTALVGILSFLAFAPYDQKWILVLSYLYLVSILTSSSTENKWLHILLWGFGLWFAGTFWLIVSIHYHGNVNIAISVTALIFLGFGWNFLFISGTSLLVTTYKENEKFKAQGLNDFVVYSVHAIGSLSAGILLVLTNWKLMNIVCIPLIAVILITILRAELIEKKTKNTF